MSSFIRRVPEGDNRERMVCSDCGHIAYENPKVVVGSVIVSDGRVLMCQRAIEPRRGFWTLPAGYLELGETLEEGAAREAQEEAEAIIDIDGLLGIYSIARISQIQVIFRARFRDTGAPKFAPGIESLDVQLLEPDAIPWDRIAFPSVHWALNAWRKAGPGPLAAPFGNPLEDRRGDHRMQPAPHEGAGEAE
ncbi:MAG TPA: NUDIX hydrolase [Rhodopila sp.]|nr:NUDIX hydrolase [Rhodopila sp.]